MGWLTVARLRVAVTDPAVVRRYWRYVDQRGGGSCWWWTGAISGGGHGRFHVGMAGQGRHWYRTGADGVLRPRNFTVIAHRFGFALAHGVEALLRVPVLAHQCDNPLCQRPDHLRPSTHTANVSDYHARRDSVGGPLADLRGSRGRAHAVRQAVRDGLDLEAIELAGAPPVHRYQQALFPAPERTYTTPTTHLPLPLPVTPGSDSSGEHSALFPLPEHSRDT